MPTPVPSLGDVLHARLRRRLLRPWRALDAPVMREIRRLQRDAALPVPVTALQLVVEMDARLQPACSASVRMQHVRSPQVPDFRGTLWEWDVLGHEHELEWPLEGHYLLAVNYTTGTFTLARGNELLFHNENVWLWWPLARRVLPPLVTPEDAPRTVHSL